MARSQNPITKAAAVVAEARRKADVADRAVARMADAKAKSDTAHAELVEAETALRALMTPLPMPNGATE